MSYLTDRLSAFDPGSRRFAPRDAVALPASDVTEEISRPAPATSGALDADMREVVDRFEAAFSALEPPAAASEPDPGPVASADSVLLDEELRKAFAGDEPSQASRAARALNASAAFAAPRPIGGREHKEQDLSIEDAMATLRASEARGKAAAVPVHRAERDEPAPPAEPQRQRRVAEAGHGISPFSADLSNSGPLAANESWTTRTRKVWPKVAGAAALALLIGTAGGYLAGKKPAGGVPAASIGTTPEGGARLRFDYDLGPR